jgi:hypothetical protein
MNIFRIVVPIFAGRVKSFYREQYGILHEVPVTRLEKIHAIITRIPKACLTRLQESDLLIACCTILRGKPKIQNIVF